MSNWRKKASQKDEVVKSVVCVGNLLKDGLDKNPVCPHGPQICYERVDKQGHLGRYFACSAFRSAKECRQNAEKIVDKRSNSGLAQYMFHPETSDFFVNLIVKLDFRHVLCLGTSTVHERLLDKKITSLLMDIDYDLVEKFRDSACHYNMCNHFFFGSDELYRKFLTESQGKILLLMDPPFSAKPVLLSAVHELIKRDVKNVCETSEIEIIWVAPYFLEGHIAKANANLVMSDYMVNYADHASFANTPKSRKHGSPVRFFTTLPLNLIALDNQNYRFCKRCDKYVAKWNKHCDVCALCTSKDGQTYMHCSTCRKCVKPTWTHCESCLICDHPDRHICSAAPAKKRR